MSNAAQQLGVEVFVSSDLEKAMADCSLCLQQLGRAAASSPSIPAMNETGNSVARLLLDVLV
jgi:hypothetical protein